MSGHAALSALSAVANSLSAVTEALVMPAQGSQHAEPVCDPGERAADVWESGAELHAFLADPRASRNASLT
jgi:hypothetical protein